MHEKNSKIVPFVAEKTASKVGQAVYDILSKPQGNQEVGETINAMAPSYFEQLEDTINSNIAKYDFPFYVVILKKKEPWALNVVRQWYVARQTKPHASFLRSQFPNHTHDVWEIRGSGDRRFLWTLPTISECQTIIKNKHLYHPELVKTIQDFQSGVLQ